jgi:maltooligosyltrehalose trehalohydrolase
MRNEPHREKVAAPKRPSRRLPVGAELTAAGTSFRVWAPSRKQVSVVIEDRGEFALAREDNGYFAGEVPTVAAGARYRFRLDRGDTLFPDPASRFQPDGAHGPSVVVDPGRFAWSDAGWQGTGLEGQVVYEMHVGTFTPEGTWAAAAKLLPRLKEVGITLIEMMPIAEFPGKFGWGYDGVDLFAPTRLYGEPDDLRRFNDAAHAIGLGVILDVVYNHFGPDGCYLREFSPHYFSTRYPGDWGEPVNFDGEDALGVRDFVTANAHYWIEEFHFDGLRLDATQQIYDSSPRHILAEIAVAARDAAGKRSIVIVAENEPQETRLVRTPEHGGYGLDALWNDDFHHAAKVAMTGRREAYYTDTAGVPQEFISAAKYGYLFQGQRYSWQEQNRGTPALDLPPQHFVLFLENHDQIANSARGERMHFLTSPGRARAMTALTLLLPGTPMLFQGQEFWSSSPFLFFADHKSDLAKLVERGRLKFLSQFRSLAGEKMAAVFAPPADPATFARSKLDWSEFDKHTEAVALHRDLLTLRREDKVFARQTKGGVDGAVLAPEAFLIRFFGGGGDDRLLLVNLGPELTFSSVPEPLLAPPREREWQVLWSSEDPRYGGSGTPPFADASGYFLTGRSALVLAPAPRAKLP